MYCLLGELSTSEELPLPEVLHHIALGPGHFDDAFLADQMSCADGSEAGSLCLEKLLGVRGFFKNFLWDGLHILQMDLYFKHKRPEGMEEGLGQH